jgi:RinA family phage transcriptional activator
MTREVAERGTYSDVRVSGGAISNPTEQRGLELAADYRRVRIAETVSRMELALARLDDDETRLVDLHYWQNWNWRACCEEMHRDKNAFYRIRQQVIEFIGFYLGFWGSEEIGKKSGKM